MCYRKFPFIIIENNNYIYAPTLDSNQIYIYSEKNKTEGDNFVPQKRCLYCFVPLFLHPIGNSTLSDTWITSPLFPMAPHPFFKLSNLHSPTLTWKMLQSFPSFLWLQTWPEILKVIPFYLHYNSHPIFLILHSQTHLSNTQSQPFDLIISV